MKKKSGLWECTAEILFKLIMKTEEGYQMKY